jgi:hypothetical protein
MATAGDPASHLCPSQKKDGYKDPFENQFSASSHPAVVEYTLGFK